MRRMMHAAITLLAFSSLANAQNNSSPYNMGDESILVQADQSNESVPLGNQDSPSLQTHPQIIPPTFIQSGCNRPYSQLAMTMNCNECCPNLWENYASERSALAAQICKHITTTGLYYNCFAHILLSLLFAVILCVMLLSSF
jgi:hypothetical protein